MRSQAKPVAAQGRVDVFAARAFDLLLLRYGNPQLRLARTLFSKDIARCFTDNLGRGTKADQFGKKLLRAAGER